MNPKQFLLIGGVVLVLVAILGFVGVIGPTPEDSLFGAPWYFDNTENWAHLILGVVALIGGLVFPGSIQKPIVVLVGVIGVLVGIYSLLGPVTEGKMLGSAALQNPADTILHIVVGLWALVAGMRKSGGHAAA